MGLDVTTYPKGRILVPNESSLNPLNVTFCGWCRWSAQTIGDNYTILFDKPYTSHVAPHYQFFMGFQGIWAKMYVSESSSIWSNTQYDMTAYYYLGMPWTFIAGVWDGIDTKVYVNESLIGATTGSSGVFTGNPIDYGMPLSIGSYGNLSFTSANANNNQYADTRMYNRALSLEEIQHIYYKKGFDNIVDGLVLRHCIDGLDGLVASGTAYDKSGNGIDGTYENAILVENNLRTIK